MRKTISGRKDEGLKKGRKRERKIKLRKEKEDNIKEQLWK